ncbi:MAG: cyanophycinase [Candidatus Dadabacteria bacterium]
MAKNKQKARKLPEVKQAINTADTASKNCPTPVGVLMIIGGKEDKGDGGRDNVPDENFIDQEILKEFVKITRKKNPVIEVISTASGEGEESFKEYKRLFLKLEVNSVGHIRHGNREEALQDPTLLERAKACDAFFFTGGDQLLLTSIYGGTSFLTEVKRRYIKENIIVAGTSAGAMAMSTPMIYAGSKEVEETAGTIKITTGLEFLKDVCIDTHFVHRGRFVRMAQVIVTNPTTIGLGIEEDTAVIVRNGLEAEIIGSGIVVVMEGFELTRSNIKEFTEKKAISLRNLKVHLLSRGDKYTIPQTNPPHR